MLHERSERPLARQLNPPLPHHGNGLDDVGRWLPTAVRLGLRVAGMEGRSNVSRLVVGRLSGWAFNIGLTYGLKHTVHTLRPDGSDRKSTPSGLAAVALMSAAVMQEEYGYLHPLLVLGSYATATATAFNRTRGNHHYAGDVLMGSGIGLLSTKMGYRLGDLLLRGHAKVHTRYQTASLEGVDRLSDVGFGGGCALPLNRFSAYGGKRLKFQPGLQTDITGSVSIAHGVGLTARVADGYFLLSSPSGGIALGAEQLALLGGPHVQTKVGDAGFVRVQALAGFSAMTSGRGRLKEIAPVNPQGFQMTTGLTGGCLVQQHLLLRLGMDFSTIKGRYHYLTPSVGLSYAF